MKIAFWMTTPIMPCLWPIGLGIARAESLQELMALSDVVSAHLVCQSGCAA